MATPLTAGALLKALRAEGLTVVEHRSWRTHNRNHVGAWGGVNGVMIHHTVTTGTSNSVELCYNGYSELPGPLCHGVIAKDGTVYLVGNGRANHAGSGDGDVLNAVIREAAPPAPKRNDTDGNRHFYGFECINRGDGRDPWPAAQLLAIERVSAAICRAHGWNERSVIGHLEWQVGKIDPKGFTMHAMRTRVAACLKNPAGQPAPSKESPMALDKNDIARVWTTDGIVPSPWKEEESTNRYWAPATYLKSTNILTRRTSERVDALTSDVAALKTQLAQVAERGLTAGQIQVAAEAGARAALAELGQRLTEEA